MPFASTVAKLRHFALVSSEAILHIPSRFDAWLDERAAQRTLYGMSERSLADIGLTHPDFAKHC